MRRKEIIEAAESEGIPPDPFLSEVKKKSVEPLAMMPVTLQFLLNEWQNNHQLPSTRVELYERSCKYLCKERDTHRTGQDHHTQPAKQHIAVASRIAAITIFCNKSAIWIGEDPCNIPDDSVTPEDLSDGKEKIDGDELQVGERVIKETLKTAFFSAHGQNRAVWNHRTYAEFLAASYVHNFKLEQIEDLILLPDDTDKRLVPQLYGTAAWLAEMNPNILQTMLQVDPEVLLRVDLENVEEQDRIAVVDALLGLYNDKRSRVFDNDRRTRYRKLNHPKLVQQLGPYIRDKTKSDAARQFAIDVAEACQLQSLQDDLADIALDASQTSYTRINAGYAVVRVGDSKTKGRLRPLAIGEAGEDPDDGLKGVGLKALWPDHMDAEELFSILTPPKDMALMGAYYSFLYYDLLQHLKPSDLPAGLRWIRQQQPRSATSWRENLEDAIILQAFEHLLVPDVLQELVEVSSSRSDIRTSWSIHARTPLLSTEDVQWMLTYYRNTTSKGVKTALAQLMFWSFDRRDHNQTELLRTASQEDSILSERFKSFFSLIENNLQEERQTPRDHLETQEPEQLEGHTISTPFPGEYISKYLDESESGNSAAWVYLADAMALEPDMGHFERDRSRSNPDVTALYGWNASDETIKSRIVKAAEKYLLYQAPNKNECLNYTWNLNSLAGLKAVLLECHKNRESPLLKDVDIWKKWAPAIIFYPILYNQNKELLHEIACQAYRYAPKEIIESLEALIEAANRDQRPIVIVELSNIIDKLEECWDERLSKAMLIQVKNPKLNPKAMGRILDVLLHHLVDESKELFEFLIPSSLPRGSKRSKTVEAAAIWFTHSENVRWSFVWSVMKRKPKFGRDVIESLMDTERVGLRSIKCLTNLNEKQLADLYIWFERQYPHEEDPKSAWRTPRDTIARFRDRILDILKERGTLAAAESIRNIVSKLPNLPWLQLVLQHAERLMYHKNWMPPGPKDILAMARNEHARLVDSGEQLLDVLIESLKSLELELQDETTPTVRFLWNECKNERKKSEYFPKTEQEFSDWVKKHLERDLKLFPIVLNREVEIKRGKSSGRGQQPDIYVNAIDDRLDEKYNHIEAIIEVKGCWSEDLYKAMEEQLVNRYLNKKSRKYGIYLACWFNCDKCSKKDCKKRAIKTSKEEAQERFNRDAAILSHQDILVKAFVIDVALH